MKKIILLGKDSGLGKQLRANLEKKTNLICIGRKDFDILVDFNKLERLIFVFFFKYCF